MLKIIRKIRNVAASFSVDESGRTHLKLSLPRSWKELTQDQLHYVCTLLASGVKMDELKHYCFLHFGNFKVVSRWGEDWIIGIRTGFISRREFFFSKEELAALSCRWLGWMDRQPEVVVRIVSEKRFKAINPYLHGLPFEDYLVLENLWQGFLYSKESEPLDRMVRILYQNDINAVPSVLRASTMLWFNAFKMFCFDHWPNLFSHSASGGEGEVDVESITNMQIRALTGGDITKEKEILQMDVWRALTELDAKAKEAKEQRQQLNNIKKR